MAACQWLSQFSACHTATNLPGRSCGRLKWHSPDSETFQEICLIEDSSTLDPVEFMQRVQAVVLDDIERIADGHFNQYIDAASIYLVSYAVVAKHAWHDEDEHSAVIDVKDPSQIKGNHVRRYEVAQNIENILLEQPVDPNADPEDDMALSLVRLYADFFKRMPPHRAAELKLTYDYGIDESTPFDTPVLK